MTVGRLLQTFECVQVPSEPLPAELSAAADVLAALAPQARTEAGGPRRAGELHLSARGRAALAEAGVVIDPPEGRSWAHVCVGDDGGHVIASHPALLYAYCTELAASWRQLPAATFADGRLCTAAFLWHRPVADAFLTQTSRTARGFDPESHVRQLARAGHTHLEVNALATPVPLEDWVPGEFYASFYSRCPAIDQFVYSELNRGTYPAEYLTANLNLLKRYAALGRRYGLAPGMVCWEPRSVPERLLQKYPTLRGARVDHPFRSRLPRYALTLSHPLVREHYREMVRKLLTAVPDLAYLSVRTNDSGAGMEHTNHLYAGRNGGAFLIREWNSHEDIAMAAGANAARFLEILQTAAAETNPDFRVTIGLGGLEEERAGILQHLTPGVDLEAAAAPEEDERASGATLHASYSQGASTYQPLLGVPTPWLVAEPLQALVAAGATHVGNGGSLVPRELAPYNVTQEVSRALVLDADATTGVDVDAVVAQVAAEWVGAAADDLVQVWRHVDTALRALPTLPLYSQFGFVWYRLWVRPLVPDLQAVPEKERRYYEDFLVSPDNNTNLVDLGRDVLFELFTDDFARDYASTVTAEVWPPLDAAIALASERAIDASLAEETRAVFVDQRDRLRGLRCWIGTLRSVAAWVAGVHGYLASDDHEVRRRERACLDEMVATEIACARDLLGLWEEGATQFMVVSEVGETAYIYGENFGELVREKIRLMWEYGHVEPHIDEGVLWRT